MLDDENTRVTRNPNPTRIKDNNESPITTRNPSLTRMQDVTSVLYYRYICIHIIFSFTYILIEFKNKLVFVVKQVYRVNRDLYSIIE